MIHWDPIIQITWLVKQQKNPSETNKRKACTGWDPPGRLPSLEKITMAG